MKLIHFLEAATTDAAAQPDAISMFAQFVPIIALVAVFYFIIYRPQKRQEKETAQMRNSLMVGDEITTNGGIVGRVVSIKDDVITIESGADRNKIKIRRWALHSIDKKVEGDRPVVEEAKTGYKVTAVKKKKETAETENTENSNEN